MLPIGHFIEFDNALIWIIRDALDTSRERFAMYLHPELGTKLEGC